MTKQQINLNGKRYLVVFGVSGPEVFVRVGRVWSGGLLGSERAAVLESVR